MNLIDAAKQALAQLEHWSPRSDTPVITNLRAAIEQAEKVEPVAWRLYKGGELYALRHKKDDRGAYYTWEPLYTHPAPIPEGWQLVPVEPTPEMLAASWETDLKATDINTVRKELYQAMLAAAPKLEGE